MPAESTLVLFSRFTALPAFGDDTEYTSLPMDVAQYAAVQFQFAATGAGGVTTNLRIYLEESLDAEHWSLGPAAPAPITSIVTDGTPRLLSYSFRLRWFRMRIVIDDIIQCWAEGLLR